MIYIIIPVHNRKQYTKDCLICLRRQTYRNFTTIVVDDGSLDGTSSMILKEFPEVVLLKGDGNLWWTKSVNMGVSYAVKISNVDAFNAVLTLNDDLLVDDNYIETLLESYDTKRKCLVGSVTVDIKEPNYLEYAGAMCNYYTAKGVRIASIFNNDYKSLLSKYSIIPTDDLSGRGTLIPLEVFENIGLYDEKNFPHYMADIEFSVRARRAGYPLFISIKSIIHNHTEATRNKKRSWSSFLFGFFSFKSPNYLKARYVFAIRHTPMRQLYFLADLSRLTVGYILSK